MGDKKLGLDFLVSYFSAIARSISSGRGGSFPKRNDFLFLTL
jgi:hypothetical protein